MLVKIRGGLGDELATTALVREFKRANPDEMIRIDSRISDVWQGNPYLNWGNVEQRGEVMFDYRDLFCASFPHSFARQLGVTLVDDTPEIWLTEEERRFDAGVTNWRRTVGIDTNVGWPSRAWPRDRFDELAVKLHERGWNVVELSRRADARRLPGALDLTTHNMVREMAALLARCTVYVGQDSGLFHLAAAVGTPQVVMFGAIPWYRRSYWNTTPLFDYAPCDARCENQKICKRPEARCLEHIDADRVADAVQVAAKRFDREV